MMWRHFNPVQGFAGPGERRRLGEFVRKGPALLVTSPGMVRRGSGRIVFLGSRVAHGMPGRGQYAASKAALVALARSDFLVGEMVFARAAHGENTKRSLSDYIRWMQDVRIPQGGATGTRSVSSGSTSG